MSIIKNTISQNGITILIHSFDDNTWITKFFNRHGNQISTKFLSLKFLFHVILIPLTFCEPWGFKERWKGTVGETNLLDEITSTVETDRTLGLRRSEFELFFFFFDR